jgi:hypothetical protein
MDCEDDECEADEPQVFVTSKLVIWKGLPSRTPLSVAVLPAFTEPFQSFVRSLSEQQTTPSLVRVRDGRPSFEAIRR